MAVNFSNPIYPLLQFNLATAEDLSKITLLENALNERLKNLDATTVSGRREFVAAVADDRIQLRKLRHQVKERQQEFIAARRQWRRPVEESVGMVIKPAEKPWFKKAMEVDAAGGETGKRKKRQGQDDVRFREAVRGLRDARRELCALGFELSDKLEERLKQVKLDAEKAVMEVEGLGMRAS
jgi:hypothetical protein